MCFVEWFPYPNQASFRLDIINLNFPRNLGNLSSSLHLQGWSPVTCGPWKPFLKKSGLQILWAMSFMFIYFQHNILREVWKIGVNIFEVNPKAWTQRQVVLGCSYNLNSPAYWFRSSNNVPSTQWFCGSHQFFLIASQVSCMAILRWSPILKQLHVAVLGGHFFCPPLVQKGNDHPLEIPGISNKYYTPED